MVFLLALLSFFILYIGTKHDAESVTQEVLDKNGAKNSPEKVKEKLVKKNVLKASPVVPYKEKKVVEDLSVTLDINHLLDDEDKTDKNKLTIQNHTNLITAFNELRGARKSKIRNVTKEQLNEWVQALVFDSYITNELGNESIPDVDLSNKQNIRFDLIPEERGLSRKLNPEYIKALRKLAKEVSAVDVSTIRSEKLLPIIGKLFSFSKRRKEQSEVFYMSLMHKYFFDAEYSLKEKITFTQQFLDVGDLKLAKYSLEYFEDLTNNQENKDGEGAILQLISDIENEIKENDY